MTIDVATGIAHILQREEIDWVSTFPVCKVNNALGREGVKLLMMRDECLALLGMAQTPTKIDFIDLIRWRPTAIIDLLLTVSYK